jgi:hypothetical protein
LARDGVERIKMDSSTLTAVARAATANDTSDRSFDVEVNSEGRGCEANDQLIAKCDVQQCGNEHPVGRKVERRVTNKSKVTRAYHLTVDLDRPTDRAAPLQMNNAHETSSFVASSMQTMALWSLLHEMSLFGNAKKRLLRVFLHAKTPQFTWRSRTRRTLRI